MLNLPRTIDVKDLAQTHSEYDPDVISRHAALYQGGSCFDKIKGEVLVRRQIETESKSGVFNGAKLFEERKKRAWYINRAGGFMDWSTSKILSGGIRIECDDEGEAGDYWRSLNEDADGLGTSLLEVARALLRGGMIHGRAYLQADFPTGWYVPADPDTGRACMRVIDAASVDDWRCGPDGALQWIRRKSSGPLYEDGKEYLQTKKTLWYWTFFEDGRITVYVAESQDHNPPQSGEASVMPGTGEPNDFKALPVFDLRLPRGLHVMDRIQDVVVALFNAEADKNSILAASAYQVLVVKTERKVPEVSLSEWGAVVLRPDEEIEFVAPQTGVYEATFKNIEILKSALYEVVQAMARDASTLPQAGRLSGDAVDAMRDPMQILLAAFAAPVRDCLLRWIRAVQKHRGEEEIDVRLVGLDSMPQANMEEVEEVIEAAPREPEEEEEEDGQTTQASD